MDFLSFFDINNTLVNISIGDGYAMSFIEAVGTIFGLLCIWFASQEKTINFLFGLINVSLFAVIFYQIQLYGLLMLQIFFFAANVYGWYAWTRTNQQGEQLQIRWLKLNHTAVISVASIVGIGLMTLYIDQVFQSFSNAIVAMLNLFGASIDAPILPPDAFPFWDSAITVLSVVAQILMTRKFVENWWLWVAVNLISIGIYAAQGVYALSLQYIILFFIAANGARQWGTTAKSTPAAVN